MTNSVLKPQFSSSAIHDHLEFTGCVVDCRQFVDHGCLSYLILSLCSYHEDVRTAGGHALTRYLLHLEGSKFKEKAEVIMHLFI